MMPTTIRHLRHWAGLFACCLLSVQVLAATEGTPVALRPLGELAIHPRVSVPATVESLNDTRLSAEVNAAVVAIPVVPGDVVEAGSILLQFDAEDYRLRLKQAQAALRSTEARLALAEYQLQRTRTLASRDVASEEQLREREAQYRGLKAELAMRRSELAMAKRQLKKCVVRAPFRAIVRERLIRLGELATPGTPLLRIVDAGRLEVVAKLQQDDVASARQAQEFIFETRETRYPVRLRVIVPLFDSHERSREARLLFTAARALPGAAGKLIWHEPQPHLPPELLIRRGRDLGVFVADDGRARFIPLPGAREGRPVKVELPDDTPIVTEGRFVLQDGDPLMIR